MNVLLFDIRYISSYDSHKKARPFHRETANIYHAWDADRAYKVSTAVHPASLAIHDINHATFISADGNLADQLNQAAEYRGNYMCYTLDTLRLTGHLVPDMVKNHS